MICGGGCMAVSQTQTTIYLQSVNFSLCILHLNKTDHKKTEQTGF